MGSANAFKFSTTRRGTSHDASWDIPRRVVGKLFVSNVAGQYGHKEVPNTCRVTHATCRVGPTTRRGAIQSDCILMRRVVGSTPRRVGTTNNAISPQGACWGTHHASCDSCDPHDRVVGSTLYPDRPATFSTNSFPTTRRGGNERIGGSHDTSWGLRYDQIRQPYDQARACVSRTCSDCNVMNIAQWQCACKRAV